MNTPAAAPSTTTSRQPVEIQVMLDPAGGWLVNALINGRVVRSRHCDDWHRVERVRRSLQTLGRAAVAAGLTAALIVGLVATPARPASAQALPTAAEQTAPAPATAEPRAMLPEPTQIGRAIELAQRVLGNADGGEEKSGLYAEMGGMITGAGWISAGPGYRQWLLGDRLFLDTSAAISWRSYKTAQARLEARGLAGGRLTLGSQTRWQDLTQLTYFGDGPDSDVEARSEYRLRSLDTVGYATLRPVRWLAVEGGVGRLGAPRLDAPGGTFQRDYPDARVTFADEPAFAEADQPAFVHGHLSVLADTRDHRSYPSAGGVYRALWIRYADRDSGHFSFTRYEAEAARFIPTARQRVVLALHGWVVGTDTSAGNDVPLYLAPSLGGANTLRSYANYRFHDRSLLLVTAEARLALFAHVDAAVFVDAGNVAPRLGDLDLARRSYGTGVRLHTTKATFARLDVAHGAEGWRLVFRTSDPLHLTRLSRRGAPAPFVP